MKIAFTGGGTGGHFYPIIAVAQAIRSLAEERRLVEPRLYYFSDTPYDPQALFEYDIEFHKIPAGKLRRYFSIKNFFDCWLTAYGILKAIWKLYLVYPDVVFSKGGYASFPTLVAARFLRIPVFIHESDSLPGRVTRWSAKFAVRVALSYTEASHYLPGDKVAVVGNPIRRELLNPITEGAYKFLELNEATPTILVLGGSLGAAPINDTLVDILPQLVEKYQIVHQTGDKNIEDVKKRSSVVLGESAHKERYKPVPFLNIASMRMAAGIANLVISRAGSTIFEIAAWGVPAIVIPIPESISHDQRTNAITYARSGAATVIEQTNLTPSVLQTEIERLLENKELLDRMRAGAKEFSRPDAAKTIAGELWDLALEHEQVDDSD